MATGNSCRRVAAVERVVGVPRTPNRDATRTTLRQGLHRRCGVASQLELSSDDGGVAERRLQTCLPRITHTFDLATVSVVLPNHKQFIRVNRMLCIAHAFIWLPFSFVPPHRKQLIELNCMPFIAHATKI